MSCTCPEIVHSFVSSVTSVFPHRQGKYLNPARYPHSRLLEINSHSLFSRWFSESGKLVQRLFNSITEMVEEEDTFVVVLIGLFFMS